MSGVFRPVGPLPASAYWIRRVLLAGLAVLVAWLLIAWLLPDSDPGKQDPAGAASTPEPTSESTPKSEPESTPKEQQKQHQKQERQKKETKAKDPHDLGELPACPDDVLSGEVAPEKDPSKAGEELALKLTFTSEAADSCKIPVSPDNVGLSIVSGSDPIWNTEDCDSVIPTGPLSMRPGEPRTITVTWPGNRSAEGCPDDADAALAGYYLVELTLNGSPLDDGQFRLF